LAFLKLFGKIEKMTQLAIKPNIFFDLATLIFATLLQKQKKLYLGCTRPFKVGQQVLLRQSFFSSFFLRRNFCFCADRTLHETEVSNIFQLIIITLSSLLFFLN
jgi:hypothetical protein